MSMKPIDAQVLYHSTPDIAKLQNIQNTRDANIQAQAAQDLKKKVDEEAIDVAATLEISESKVHRDPNKEKGKEQQEQKKKKDNNGDQQTSTIDIRI